jgi:hypothetical protein
MLKGRGQGHLESDLQGGEWCDYTKTMHFHGEKIKILLTFPSLLPVMQCSLLQHFRKYVYTYLEMREKNF